MGKGKVLTLEDRIPKLKAQRKQRANRRLITYISFFFLLLIGIIYFQSPLNEIDELEISGNYFLKEDLIVDKLSISKNTKYWTTDLDKLKQKLESLAQIKSVEITRIFPNDLAIKISEFDRIGYVEKDGSYYPILDNGKILDSKENKTTMINAPVLVNWVNQKALQMMAKQLKALPNGIANRISEIVFHPTASDSYSLILYMNDGNEVRATITNFAKRMSVYPSIVEKLASEEPRVIHMTVSPWAEKFPSKQVEVTQEEGVSEVDGQTEESETTQGGATQDEN